MTQLGDGVADEGAPTYVRMGQLIGVAIATTAPEGGARPTSALPRSGRPWPVPSWRPAPKGDPQKAPLVLVVLGDDADDDVIWPACCPVSPAGATGVVAVGDTDAADSGDLSALRTSAAHRGGRDRRRGRARRSARSPRCWR